MSAVHTHSINDVSEDNTTEPVVSPLPSPSPTYSYTSTDTVQTTETDGTDDPTTESDEAEEQKASTSDDQQATTERQVNRTALSDPEVDTAEKFFYVLCRKSLDGRVFFNNDSGSMRALVKKYREDMPRILIQLAKLYPTFKPSELYPYDLFTEDTTQLVTMVYNIQLKRVGGDTKLLMPTFPPRTTDEPSTIKAEADRLEHLMKQGNDRTWKLKYYQVRRVWGDSVKELATRFKVEKWNAGVQNFRTKWEQAFVVDGVTPPRRQAVARKDDETDIQPLLTVPEAQENYLATLTGHPGDFVLLYGENFADLEANNDDAGFGFGVDVDGASQQENTVLEQLQQELDELETIPRPSRPPPQPRAIQPVFLADSSAHVPLDRTTTRRWIQPTSFPGILPKEQPIPFIYAPTFLCGQLRPVKDAFYPFTLKMLYVSACSAVFYYTMARETYPDKEELLQQEQGDLKMTLYRVMSRYYSLHPVWHMTTIADTVRRENTSAMSLYDSFFNIVDTRWLGLESHYLKAAKQMSEPTITLEGGDIVLLGYLQERANSDSKLPWSYNIRAVKDASVHFSLTMDIHVGPTMAGEWAKYRVAAVLIDNQLLLQHLGTWYKITQHTGTGGVDVDIALFDTRGHDIFTINAANKGYVLLNRIR